MRFIDLNTGRELTDISADLTPGEQLDVEAGQPIWLQSAVYVCFAIVREDAYCLPHPLANKPLRALDPEARPVRPYAERKDEADRMHLAYLAQGWMVARRLGEYVEHVLDDCDQAVTVRRENALLGNDGLWRIGGHTVLDPQPLPCSCGLDAALSQGAAAGVLAWEHLPPPITVPADPIPDTSWDVNVPLPESIARVAGEVAARKKKYVIAAAVNHLTGEAVEQGAERAALTPVMETLYAAAHRAEEGLRILQRLAVRTAKGERTDVGAAETGLGVDLTAEVLLNIIDTPACQNFAHFQITQKGEVRAIVTVQKPDGKSPIELFRELDAKHQALKAVATEVYAGGEFGDGGATYTGPGQTIRDLGSALGLRDPKEPPTS